MPALIFLAAFGLLLLVYVLVQYNGLTNLRNHIENAWSNIDTELKRRHDLIPNLVATVRGYATHESDLLQQVTNLRNQCARLSGNASQQSGPEGKLVGVLQRLMMVVENYPNLKSDRNFLELQNELVNTEDRIQAARRFYNGNVRDYKVKCESFPSNMVALLFGFEPQQYFDVEPSTRDVPNANLHS